MQRLAQEGMTMLVVTHEMAFARDVSNQVVFMHQGDHPRTGGDPAEFFGEPAERRSARISLRASAVRNKTH